MSDSAIQCLICGQQHILSDMELSFGLPDEAFTIAETERDKRVKATDDICVIDEQRFYLRSVLGLPLIDQAPEQYHFGVWAEVGPADFKTIFELWDDPAQTEYPAFQARLGNNIPFCGQTNGLNVSLKMTGPSTRPALTVTDIESVLGQLQGKGIYINDAMRFLHFDQDLPEDLA
jgi:hypothetical protein